MGKMIKAEKSVGYGDAGGFKSGLAGSWKLRRPTVPGGSCTMYSGWLEWQILSGRPGMSSVGIQLV